jgi:hypothetical protein
VYPRLVEPMLRKLDPVCYERWYVTERRPVVAATFERLKRYSQALYQSARADGAPDHGRDFGYPK